MWPTYVVYLVWPPMGIAPVRRFARSYREHAADHEHRLVIVHKGPSSGAIASECQVIANSLDAEFLEVPPLGRDLDTYRQVADQLRADTLCLLNTSSEILAKGWLCALHEALSRPDIGLVGASGSFESSFSAAPRPLRPFVRRRFPPFPNPHIRTNAFMLDRELMLDLRWPGGGGKRRALALESGRDGITRQIQARGLRAVVVGRDRRIYEPAEWQRSATFRSGGQANLLIADNRTRQYADASPAARAQLELFAWGAAKTVSVAPPAPAPRA
jgi:hypothetical protein